MSMIPFLAFLFSPAFAPEPKPAPVLPEPPDEVGKALLRAADILRKKGWFQGGGGEGPNGSVCAGRALSLVTGGPYYMGSPTAEAAWKRMGAVVGREHHEGPAFWNDHIAKNAQEVISVMEKAAYLK